MQPIKLELEELVVNINMFGEAMQHTLMSNRAPHIDSHQQHPLQLPN